MEQATGLSKEILPEQEFFQTLFENSSTGAALADVEGHFLSTNRSLQKMLDRSDEEFRHMLLQDLTDDEAAPDAEPLRDLLANQSGGFKIETRRRRRDGTLVFLSVSVSLIPSAVTKPAFLVALVDDVSQRKQGNETSSSRERFCEAILDNSPDIMYLKDLEGRFLLVNKEFDRCFHVTQQQIASKRDSEILHRTQAAALRDSRLRVLQTGSPVSLELTVADGDELLLLHIREFPVRDDHGNVSAIGGIGSATAVESTLGRSLIPTGVALDREDSTVDSERQTARDFGEVIGSSYGLRQVLQQVMTVARTDAAVLILGETGTGKELVARAIHRLSSRRDHPLVRADCASIPAGLLESELFGHERGAFTGAVARAIGRVEMADGGTLFLDEVGDIPLELQSKLLRVLQEQEIERLGSGRTIHVNFRVIAATSRDLACMIERGQFRRDLYYRLNVFPIELPPLRDRPEDIPLLVWHFAKKYAQLMNKHVETIRSEDMETLVRYRWPGNIRELQNAIERAVILSRDQVLKPAPLAESKNVSESFSSDLRTLGQAEREHILKALQNAEWVIGGPEGAAAQLGVRRTTLLYKMRRLGISRPAK